MIEQDTDLKIGTNSSSQQTAVLGTLLHRLLDTFQERLKELELKEVKDDFINGQIYEITTAINHLQTAYLNCL